jgi:type II secretory pathway component GspD/PulD (secretin)/tetratricopeptide (TPR) repeat protein
MGPEGGDVGARAGSAADVRKAEQDFLVQQYIAKAQAALEAGNRDEALEWYGKAVALDPTNAEARQGWRSLSEDRPSTVGEYFGEQRGVELVRRQQAAAEVRTFVERGRVLESQESYDQAVQEYQKALAIVSWYDDTSDFGIDAARLRDLIDNAKYKAETAARMARQEQIRAAQIVREEELAAMREAQMGRIQAHFEQANVFFRRGEYAVAREYAKAILREDPTNRDAERIVAISYDAEHMTNERENRARFDDQWKSMMEDLEQSMMPQVKTVVYSDDWLDEIAPRKPRVVGDEAPADEASSIAGILSVIETKRVKNLTWEDADLEAVVSLLRTVTGLNFYITPKVKQEKMEEVRVTLSVDDVTVRTILGLVTEPYGLKWEPRDGVVWIAAADEVSGTMRLRYFDINDLNVAIKSFVGEEINLWPSNFTPPEPPELPEPTPQFPSDQLVELIKETIGKEGSWEDPATLEAKKGILIARNTPEILDQVDRLLSELRANTGLLVNLEVRFLSAEDNFLRDVGVDVRGLGDDSGGVGAPGLGTTVVQDDVFFGSPASPFGVPFGVFPEPSSVGTSNDAGIFYNDGSDGRYAGRVENLFDLLLGNPDALTSSGGLSFQHTFLDDTQLEVILRAVEKSERIQEITAPRITVYNTQRANVSVLNQVSYVQDYEVEIAQASNIANPVVQTIRDGIVLDVRPVVSADRRYVNLELRPTVAVLTRPIATFSTSLASGPVTASAPVIIQIPELKVSRVRTTVSMPDGGTLLLGGLKFYEQETLNSEVPILSKLPLLSFLFSRKGHYVNRKNLLVLISAQIVPLEEMEPKGDLIALPIPEGTWGPTRPAEPCPIEPVPPCGNCGHCSRCSK